MRLLFTSAQLPGHLDWGGYLQTAALLAQRGHDVLWVSGPHVADQVARAGVPFRAVAETGWRWPPPPPLDRNAMPHAAWLVARMQRAVDQWLGVDLVTAAAAELETITRTFRPHLIVTEPFVAAAALVAERLDLPLVVAGWPAIQRTDIDPALPPTPIEIEFGERLASWGSSGRYFTQVGPPGILSPYLHVTFWTPSWYGAPGAPLPGTQTRHVGGKAPLAQPPPQDFPSPQAQPWVFITLGTAFNQDPAFFSLATHAAVQCGAQPIIATGPLTDDDRAALAQRLPPDAILRPSVDFAAVLPYTAAAIHHGGAGTTHALVTHAVPQIVVPHAGDQMQQAQGVANTSIGFVHMRPAAVIQARLTEEIHVLLEANCVERAAARRLRAEFAASGGPALAADLIEEQAATAAAH